MDKKQKQIIVASVIGVLALIVLAVNFGLFSGSDAVSEDVGQAATEQAKQIEQAAPPPPPAPPANVEPLPTTKGTRK